MEHTHEFSHRELSQGGILHTCQCGYSFNGMDWTGDCPECDALTEQNNERVEVDGILAYRDEVDDLQASGRDA